MKVLPAVWNLRTRRAFVRIFEALVPASERHGARIVHYSVQSDHLHLIAEARSGVSLSRAMQGLAVRIARRLNRMMGRRGKVFADRFHDRPLTTPRQVRHALAYVLCNARKHGHAPDLRGWFDPFSSAELFDGWRGGRPRRPWDGSELAIAPPRTWLLTTGWRRGGGAIDPDHRPGPLSDAGRS